MAKYESSVYRGYNNLFEKNHNHYRNNSNYRPYLYCIHGILNISSPVPLSELYYFQVKQVGSVDLSIKEPINGWQKNAGARKIFRSKTAATYSEHLDALGAKVCIEFLDKLQVSVSKLLLKSPHVLYVNVVEPLLRLLFASKGYMLLHSACLSRDGEGYLISAPPDTGKTTTVLRCIKEAELEFLSDDMTIVDSHGNLLTFPKPFTISSHTYHAFCSNGNGSIPSLRIRGYAHSRMGRKILRLLGKLKIVPIFTVNAIAQYFVKPPKVKITELVGDVNHCRRTTMKSMYFLLKGRSEIREISAKEAVTKAIWNSDDAFFFPPYDQIFPHIRINGFSFKDLLMKERQILSKILSNREAFILQSENHGWSQMLSQSISMN